MADFYKTRKEPNSADVSADTLVPIPGNTYPVRAELKALGATWDSNERAWKIATDKLAQARAIVDNQAKTAPETLTAARKEASKAIAIDDLEDPFEGESSEPRLVPITGNTYPVKEALKAIGATWNKEQRAWMIAEEKAEYARAIVQGDQNAKPLSNDL